MASIKEYPKISIVTPNYNKARYIQRTIESVINQGYPNLEYIIIDGASTDGSAEIIKNYDSKLAYWVSEKDNGMYEAIDKGFRHSSGEIMGWLGSDDMLHPGSLFILAKIFTDNPQIDWLTGANTWFDAEGHTIAVKNCNYLNRLDLLSLNFRWIQQESTFWRRSLYEKAAGINTTMRLAGDFDLWLRFSRFSRMWCTDALIGGFRQIRGGSQLSDDMDRYVSEVQKCIAEELKTYPGERDKVRLVYMKRRLRHLLHLPLKHPASEASKSEAQSQRIYYDHVDDKFYPLTHKHNQ